MNKLNFKIQVILAYMTITISVIICLFGLGFMSSFYTLFMNGDDVMYSFFKDLQSLNSSIFVSGLIFLVLSLFLIPFDINKKIAGVFGVLLTLSISIINIINGISIFNKNTFFKNSYLDIDFSKLENYTPSTMLFDFNTILFTTGIIISLLLFLVSTINFLNKSKEGDLNAK